MLLCPPPAAMAHPLGNFTVNRYSRLELSANQVYLTYIVDMAEVPSTIELPRIDTDGDFRISPEEERAYLQTQATALARGLMLTVSSETHGSSSPNWQPVTTRLQLPPGEDLLPTVRVEVEYRAVLPDEFDDGEWLLTYRDSNYTDREVGWQEIVVQAGEDVALLDSSVSDTDQSDGLRSYPENFLDDPLQIDAAVVRFQRRESGSRPTVAGAVTQTFTTTHWLTTTPGVTKTGTPTAAHELTAPPVPTGITAAAQVAPGPIAAAEPVSEPPTRLDRLRTWWRNASADRFGDLIAEPVTGASALVVTMLAAFGWGALHAMSPGHGKTVVAAYLVGSRGTLTHALFLGLTTTVTHTAGVIAFGLLTLFVSRYILPETLYPWLSVISGLLVFAVGVSILRSRVRTWRAGIPDHHHVHVHDHDHGHAHHHHSHDHNHHDAHAHDHAHDHDHDHDHEHGHSHVPPGADGAPVTWRSLLMLGISGGLLPCPSALVVMLGAIALGQAAWGLVLVLIFSVGLATVLTATGILFVYAGRLFERIPVYGPATRLLPIGSALIITLAGVGITVQAVWQTGIL